MAHRHSTPRRHVVDNAAGTLAAPTGHSTPEAGRRRRGGAPRGAEGQTAALRSQVTAQQKAALKTALEEARKRSRFLEVTLVLSAPKAVAKTPRGGSSAHQHLR